MGDPEENPSIAVGVAANLRRMYAADQRDFAENLAAMLESALPNETEIDHRGGFFSPKTISKISVRLGENLYILDAPSRGPLAASVARVVRGIRLRTEPVPIAEWLGRFTSDLSDHAEESLQALGALKQFMEGES